MRSLSQSLKLANQQVRSLEAKVKQLIDKDGVTLQATTLAIWMTCCESLPTLAPMWKKAFLKFSSENFLGAAEDIQRLEGQTLEKWHLLVLRFALNLKYMSTSAYCAVQLSGIISLPSIISSIFVTTSMRQARILAHGAGCWLCL